MDERPVTTLNKPDVALEMTLRPSLFSDFTGQAKVKERLEIAGARGTDQQIAAKVAQHMIYHARFRLLRVFWGIVGNSK